MYDSTNSDLLRKAALAVCKDAGLKQVSVASGLYCFRYL